MPLLLLRALPRALLTRHACSLLRFCDALSISLSFPSPSPPLPSRQHVYIALALALAAPTAWLLREAGMLSLTGAAANPWVRNAIANSYYGAQAVALARVFLGLKL